MKSSNRGFTLAELLLAAAIFAFALSGILVLFINCIFLNEANRNLTAAITHAEFVLEDIRNTPFFNISSAITAGNWDWSSATITSNGLIALNSESMDTQASGTTLLDVTVTVNWKDFGRRDKSVSLSTSISEP